MPRTHPDLAEDAAAADAAPLAALAAAAQSCRRCPLHARATQVVFGEGPEDAPVLFVGEQPGDQEDRAGRPFVGPAGALLDRALEAAGLDRARVYMTNAVKHFKYEPRGKRRIHAKPNAGEIQACRWWLDREIARIRPCLAVALGATAGRALAGRSVSVMRERGPLRLPDGVDGFLTVHPSHLLRVPGAEARRREYERFLDDLAAIAGRVPAIRRGG